MIQRMETAMNSLRTNLSKPHQVLLALSLAILSALPSAMAQFADIDEPIIEPQYVAGGHYTAEVDLQLNALTLLPIDAPDMVVPFQRCAAISAELPSGVYLVGLDAQGLRLDTTHPLGARALANAETHRVLPCGLAGSDANALYLPSEVLAALDAKSVGAVYLKR
jgi:hypothetical protein